MMCERRQIGFAAKKTIVCEWEEIAHVFAC